MFKADDVGTLMDQYASTMAEGGPTKPDAYTSFALSASVERQMHDFDERSPMNEAPEHIFDRQLAGLSVNDMNVFNEPFVFPHIYKHDLRCDRIQCSPWKKSGRTEGSFNRRVCFRKPIDGMAAILGGADHANCTAMFQLTSGEMVVIEQRVKSEGPSYTDMFWVDTRYEFSAHPEGGLRLQVWGKVQWISKPWTPGVMTKVESTAKAEILTACEAVCRYLSSLSPDLQRCCP